MDVGNHVTTFIPILVIQLCVVSNAAEQLLTRDFAASEKSNDLSCYQCNSMTDGDKCVGLAENDTSLMLNCPEEQRICMVNTISYTLISTGNSTPIPQMWSLQRNCTTKCEAGCIIIGERTKLYSCTSCCEDSLCNTENGEVKNSFTNTNA